MALLDAKILETTVTLALVFVGACAEEHYTNVQNPGAGQVEYDRDDYQCRRENTNALGEWDLPMTKKCMQVRGWRTVSLIEEENLRGLAGWQSRN